MNVKVANIVLGVNWTTGKWEVLLRDNKEVELYDLTKPVPSSLSRSVIADMLSRTLEIEPRLVGVLPDNDDLLLVYSVLVPHQIPHNDEFIWTPIESVVGSNEIISMVVRNSC